MVATVLWNAGAGCADEVRLHNGDSLTGTILSLTKDKLLLDTSYAGELAIRREEIAVLKTDNPMVVVFTGEQQRIGWLDATKAGNNFFLSDHGIIFFRLEEIAAVRPLTAEEIKRTAPAGRPPLWTHQMEFGAQVRSGNIDSRDIALQFQSQRIARQAELLMSVAAAFSKTEGERTAEQVLGAVRLDLLHTPRLFSFSLMTLERDVLEELLLRAQEQAGIGYKFIRTPQTLLQGVVGLGFREELFADKDLAVKPIGRLGIEWTQGIGQASELAVQVAFLPDLRSLGEYRFEAEASLTTPITHRFHLRFSVTDSFDSTPQPGVSRNDLTLLSSVVWRF
jgi:putative salt-induced outer membrane protein YdiY